MYTKNSEDQFLIYSRKLLFKVLVVVVVVVVDVQFRQTHLKNQTRYRSETWHDDQNL